MIEPHSPQLYWEHSSLFPCQKVLFNKNKSAHFFNLNLTNQKQSINNYISLTIYQIRMSEADDSLQQNYLVGFSQQASQAEKTIEKQYIETIQPRQDNPESTVSPKLPGKNEMQNSSSKLLMKQKDRYENNAIQKGMFATMDESVDELKIIYNDSSPSLKKDESNSSIKKRLPLKLAPIQTFMKNDSVKIIDQDQINKNSKTYQQIQKKNPSKLISITPIRLRQIINIQQFCKQSIPKNKKMISILKRNRQGSQRLCPKYDLCLNQELKFLMSSKKKAFHLSSTYVIGTKNQPSQETDKEYVGTLKSNFVGSEFNLFENSSQETQLLATISYCNTMSCADISRSLEVYMLSPSYKYEDLTGADDLKTMNMKQLYELGQNKQNGKILKLANKKPTWDAKKQIWCMDFHGRAKYSSVKNMILVDANDQSKEVMILAKADENVFNVDVFYPLSPRIALAIATSSFDFKWACQ